MAMSRYPLSTPTRAASSLAYVRLVACIRSPAIRRADSKLVGARLSARDSSARDSSGPTLGGAHPT